MGTRAQPSATHVPAGTVATNAGRCVTRREIALKEARGDDGHALRLHAFVVIGKGSEAGAVLGTRIGYNVDEVAAVAKSVELIEREE